MAIEPVARCAVDAVGDSACELIRFIEQLTRDKIVPPPRSDTASSFRVTEPIFTCGPCRASNDEDGIPKEPELEHPPSNATKQMPMTAFKRFRVRRMIVPHMVS